MKHIKTAMERFKAYCESKGIPEKSSLAHIHKMSQFEEHERKELRAALEASQAELEKARQPVSDEQIKEIIKRIDSDKRDYLTGLVESVRTIIERR